MLAGLFRFGALPPPAGLLRRNLRRACPRDVLLAPPRKGTENFPQGFAFFRQPISVTHRVLLIGSLINQACFFQSLQPVGKDVGRNPFGRILQLFVRGVASHQISNDEQRPLIADKVERVRDGARRTQESLSLGFRLASLPPRFSNLHSES